MVFSAPKGTFDILPGKTILHEKEKWRSVELWQHIEATIRNITKDYGYSEIRTPVFEQTELFQRGVGTSSDLVIKQMYTFEDKKKRLMTLRPEGTAPVMRAYLEEKWHNDFPCQKLYYIGPMFRYERPQAGRYRQHHQFGAEAIGNAAPEQDVELIVMLCAVYRKLGMKNLRVYLNSIGSVDCRKAFQEDLKEYLRPKASDLSKDSQRRLETHPLRILDSKDKADQKVVAKAPSILKYLDEESKDHFERVKQLLTSLNIDFEVNPLLVRGLDYYNKTVFEVVSGELGAQDSVGGGGRYDGLIKTLGGPDIPAIGFGTGIERMIQTLLGQKVPPPEIAGPTVFFIPLGEEAKKACFILLHNLRAHGISSSMDFSGKKLKKVLSYANKLEAEYVAIIGDEEIQSDTVDLKQMQTGNLIKTSLSMLPLEVIKLLSERRQHTLDQMTSQLSEILEKGLSELEEAEQIAYLSEIQPHPPSHPRPDDDDES